MVEVRVADEKDLHISKVKPQFFDALPDQRDGSFQIAVNQNVPGGCRNQVRGEPSAAYVIDVADHAMRRERFAPVWGTQCCRTCVLRKSRCGVARSRVRLRDQAAGERQGRSK